tara:strand:+ start:1177 stop:1443 length:267 start_codon:yes stop_codon:yes gene_type:complete
MELITFNDICRAIGTALIDGCYEPHFIAKWDSIYSNGSFQEEWQGYVENVESLCSFLRVVVGIDNDTEQQLVLHAVSVAFKESFRFNH